MSSGKSIGSWLRKMIREHRVISGVLAAYLLLSAVEIVRVLLYDRPREYDAGMFQPETAQREEGPRRFAWTRGGRADLLRPLWGPVMRIPLYVAHPDPPEGGVTVRLYVGEELFDEAQISNGWHRRDYFLPPILGSDPWEANAAGMSLAGVAELDVVAGDEPFLRPRWILQRRPDYVRVFTDWHRQPGPSSVWFQIETSETFVPAEHTDTSDRRELGIGVGELLWLPELPADGIGLYASESHEGEPFRWARQRASLKVAAAPAGVISLVFPARVATPDVSDRPVEVVFYWNTDLVDTVSFGDLEWRTVRLDGLADAGRGGVLTAVSSRTWNPAAAAVAPDNRDLGVALGEPRWE